MGVSILYDQERFSDLTLQLTDRTTIRVHKTIICTKNKYFDMMCGLTAVSRYERDKPLIELDEDEPAAAEAVLRHIYCLPMARDDESWRYWLSVRKAADKYLEPLLSTQAWGKLRSIVYGEHNMEEAANFIQAVKSEFGGDKQLADFAYTLLSLRLKPLLQIPSFCEWHSGEDELMIRLLKQLTQNRSF